MIVYREIENKEKKKEKFPEFIRIMPIVEKNKLPLSLIPSEHKSCRIGESTFLICGGKQILPSED
jgi:hypothetical protein